MLKFIRGKGSHISAERIKVQKELFSLRKTISHGFPSKPTALAYNAQLGLLAIANKSGAIIVVGQPGVEFVGHHPQEEESAVTKIVFVPKKGRIITLCDDNSLHMWKFSNSSLELVKSYSLEGKLKKISSLTVQDNNKNAYVGTEGGNIYTLDIDKFAIGDKIIYLDVVLQNGPENYKINPGAVESILEVPHEMKLLIGYERGLIVLWDIPAQKNTKNFVSTQRLEDLTWLEEYSEGAEGERERLFASAHNDGSYIIWNLENNEKPYKEATTPYGPFPCKRLGKIRFWKDDCGELIVAFSGGMPRAAHGDHFTVSIKSEAALEGEEPHVAFDLTSKVIDFVVIRRSEIEGTEGASNDINSLSPLALVILAEEEMVTVDLTSENWSVYFPQPYLNSIHPSAVTCFHHVANVADDVYNALVKIGHTGDFSKNAWPITGGKIGQLTTNHSSKNFKAENLKSLLITGHEDGSIRFWDSTTTCLTLLTKFTSSVLFTTSEETEFANESSNNRDEDEEEWPPFKKVGTFDPYSDDPRLAVKKIGFCKKSGVLIIGGTAGQIIVVNSVKKLVLQEEATKLEVTMCNMVADKDGFVWKGHDSLEYRPKNNPNIGNSAGEDSFNITALLQIQPPAAVTALAIEAPSGVVAVGTAHGVLLFDFFRKKVVMVKSTLNPNDIMAAGDTPISRRKSIKKSLRESFRRLRKGRSQRAGTSSPVKSPSLSTMQSPDSSIPTKPMERAIEARGSDDAMSSMVRSVTFSKTYIVSLQTTTHTLWAGTNSGTVYVFTVNIPGGERRSKEDASCQIAKEIQLKHRAPVLSVIILDCNSSPVEGFSPQHDHLGPHKVLICSEEQIKMFTLPALRPFGKLKLTAQEGSRIRKITVQTFVSSADDSYSEKCASCLTNQGDLYIITVPELRKQVMFPQCLKREDITGISSFTFNDVGEAFYQVSSSELQRISVSAKVATRSNCAVVGVDGKVEANHVEENHVREVKSPSAAPAASTNNTSGIDDISSEIADITIDSVRDHTSNNAATTINTTVVEERLIDGGALISPTPGVTNQIKSVTTVTTTTVVNSVQTSTANQDSSSSSSSVANGDSTTTSSTSTATTVVRAPIADSDEDRIQSEI